MKKPTKPNNARATKRAALAASPPASPFWPEAGSMRITAKQVRTDPAPPDPPGITAVAFQAWLATMKLKRIAFTDAEAAKLLDVHVNTLSRWKRDGAPHVVALACWALDNHGKPWKIAHPST